MARPDERAAREQGIPEHQTPKTASKMDPKVDLADQAYRRLREAIEDDEAREALKSRDLQDRRAENG